MKLLKKQQTTHAPALLQHLGISYHSFDVNRCDEKTLYITVELHYNTQKVVCDLIYLVDRPDMYGAISINEHYPQAKHFIKKNFNHTLMYSDETKLAQSISQTTFFKQSLQQFAKTYPKFTTNNLKQQ